MIRKFFIAASIGAAIVAAGSLAPSRANAMPMGLPTDIADQINVVEPVAFCFYVDGWNGPGLYQCGYRLRRGFGWHGARGGGGRSFHGGGGGRGHVGGGGGRGGRGGGGRGHGGHH
jgi:hypothetical protein